MPDTHRILLSGSKMVASFTPYEYEDHQGMGGRVILTDDCVEVEIRGTWEELARIVDYTAISFWASRRRLDIALRVNDKHVCCCLSCYPTHECPVHNSAI